MRMSVEAAAGLARPARTQTNQIEMFQDDTRMLTVPGATRHTLRAPGAS
jgi:hypothetical protein